MKEDIVQLFYGSAKGDKTLSEDLQQLVFKEQGCCGAAGVEFELVKNPGLVVNVRLVREGVPGRTVLAAFAEMKSEEA